MKRAFAAFALALGAACGGAAKELPPHGEALFVVDTDLAVPTLAGRLRVDIYSEEGAWLDSRDIGRSDPRDWPASFSVFSDDDTRPRRALVRLRAYPEGAVRRYQGESPPSGGKYVPPRVATSLDDLCANAPPLPIGGRITLRQGADPIAQHTPAVTCPNPAVAGAVAARVTITDPGAYRFSVADSDPYANVTTLSLRSSCADAASQLACERVPDLHGPLSPGHFARFDATLAPGTYWLLSTGALPAWPADTTLEVMPLDTPLPPVAPDVPQLPATSPRLVRDGVDRTPDTEPVQGATVERLVLVELSPGQRGSVRVTLRGACAGTAARLGSVGAVDLASAATCVDTEGARVPVSASPLDPDMTRGAASVQGTFGPDEPCTSVGDASRVCVPGGVFLFGSQLLSLVGVAGMDLGPQRVAVMPRFWIDRHEYTVARLRSVLARGFVLRDREIWQHDGPFPTTFELGSTRLDDFCTWSATPLGREDHPLNCISWRQARELCRFDGGDLPTEAEWVYAASAAGRRFPATFPWGEDADPCRHGVFGRFLPGFGAIQCPGAALGPAPVTASDGLDVTPSGVVGLGGSVAEWSLDASGSYDGPCWAAAGLVSPRCEEPDAPVHPCHGSDWSGVPGPSVMRGRVPSAEPGYTVPFDNAQPQIGFRCAYTGGSP